MTYMRSWRCARCHEPQQSIDRPKVAVCGGCMRLGLIIKPLDTATALLSAAQAGYERGFIHGKQVVDHDLLDRLRDVIEDLLEHENDFPTDLDRGTEYRRAFARAREAIGLRP